MIQLIAFLGNYGREYENSRHNTAWLFEKSLPFSQKFSWQSKYKSDFCAVDYDVFASWLKECALIKVHQDGTVAVPKDAPKKLYFIKPMDLHELKRRRQSVRSASFLKFRLPMVLVVRQ